MRKTLQCDECRICILIGAAKNLAEDHGAAEPEVYCGNQEQIPRL